MVLLEFLDLLKCGFVRHLPEGRVSLASRIFAILRLRRQGPIIDPAVLFRLLYSSMEPVTVQSQNVGSVISGLQMADFPRLPVLVPAVEAQHAITSQIHAAFDVQDEVQLMRGDLVERQKTIWPEMDPAASEDTIPAGAIGP